MNKESGFTLLELLFVLLIISIFILLTTPSMVALKEKSEVNAFKHLLDADILYIQNKAFHHRKEYILGFLRNNQYVLHHGKVGNREIVRQIPSAVSYSMKNTNIMYNLKGTIIQPGTYVFIVDGRLYRLVFPLGKGKIGRAHV